MPVEKLNITGLDNVLGSMLNTDVTYSGSQNPGNFVDDENGVPDRTVDVYRMLAKGPLVEVKVKHPVVPFANFRVTITVKGKPYEYSFLQELKKVYDHFGLDYQS